MEYVMLITALLLAIWIDFIPRLGKKNKAEIVTYCILFTAGIGFLVCYMAGIYWISPSRLIRLAMTAFSGQ